MRRGAVSLFALTVLETLSCDNGNGVTGPPPLPPDLVTENEARQIIEQVFADSGVQMERDLRLMLHLATNDSVEIELDGFNDSLQVGYEYVLRDDRQTYAPHVWEALDSLMNENGPYIKPIDAIIKDDDYSTPLRAAVQEFIDTLRAHGII